jgi:ubiquinone biosynthesis monooxygenase Coq6
MKVWDGVSGSKITFDWHSVGASPYGGQRNIAYMTENANLTSGLLQRAHELGGIEMMDNVKVANIQLGEDTGEHDMRSWPVISLSSGATIAARLLVGADGANSPVRTFAGIASRGWDYNRHGLVATLRLGTGTSSDYNLATAYQRFLPTGPAALLPLPNGQASLVWSTTPAHASALKALSTADFLAMVNAAFRLSPTDLEYLHTMPAGQVAEVDWRMQHTAFDNALVPPMIELVQEGSIASFPLKLRHADTYTGERVAVVGDAAHTIHPLAGQGLNQGQGDVQALLDAITEAVETGQDIGSTIALESYNLKRYAANNMLMGVVDKLHKLYSVQSGPVVTLRSWGLSAVDAVPSVKEFFMKRAAGL